MAASILLLSAASGCGGEKADPAENVMMAADNARDAGSAHAQMSISLDPVEGESGMGLNVQGDAWMDMAGETVDARFTVMGMEVSLRYVEGDAYIELGGKWYLLSPDVIEGMGEGTVEALVKVILSYPDIFASASNVKELGEKRVGDFDCTEYEVEADLQAVAALEPVQELAPELGMTPDEIEDYLREAGLEMKVCVQKDEPVIREIYLAATMDLPDIGEVAGMSVLPSRANVRIQIAFPDYGMTVDVQAPPDARPFEGL